MGLYPAIVLTLPSLLWCVLREIQTMFTKYPPVLRLKTLASVFVIALALPAGAQTSRDEQIDEHFAAADTNHDGQLTLTEAQAGMPRVASNFDKIDADQSGTVTLTEIKALADR